MEVTIRAVKIEDSQAINEIRKMKGVKENTLAISSERIEKTKKITENLDINNHILVAEVIENNDKNNDSSKASITCFFSCPSGKQSS